MTHRRAAGTRLPFILLATVAAIIATATILEKRHGSTYAVQHVYHASWFIALWALMAIAACVLLWKKRIWKNPPVMLIHAALLVILTGALTTHLTSRHGMTHLREGEATRTFWVKDQDGAYTMSEEMPFYLALSDFRIVYDNDSITPSDYVSHVVIATTDGEQPATISMNNIARVRGYRIYQTSFDDDTRGSTFTISYDPWGTPITYAGYLLLAIGMVGMKRKDSPLQDSPPEPVQPEHLIVPSSWHPVREGAVTFESLDADACSVHSAPSLTGCQEDGTIKCSGWTGSGGESSRWVFCWKDLFVWLAAIALASYMVIAIAIRPLLPVLRSPFLVLHVGTIMLSYILLVVSILRREVLRPAVFLLATGIFLGAVWANVSWGSYWSWDPKESWALVTLIIYSIPLHQRSLPWFRSQRNYRIYSIIALASLLMTYFGVNFLLGGMHSYA